MPPPIPRRTRPRPTLPMPPPATALTLIAASRRLASANLRVGLGPTMCPASPTPARPIDRRAHANGQCLLHARWPGCARSLLLFRSIIGDAADHRGLAEFLAQIVHRTLGMR